MPVSYTHLDVYKRQPLRVALSGTPVTPGGAIEIAYLLGRHEALSRIETGIRKLEAVSYTHLDVYKRQ